jgi:hypothetical protein
MCDNDMVKQKKNARSKFPFDQQKIIPFLQWKVTFAKKEEAQSGLEKLQSNSECAMMAWRILKSKWSQRNSRRRFPVQ